jgi:uncharacterized protein YjbI with pentapeptide repeats
LKLIYELGLINRNSNGHKSIIELRNAGLDHANFRELTLRNANLRGVDLRGTNLSGADLSCSDLALADLRGANLRRANLKGTDLKDANFLPYDAEHPERWSWHKLTRIDNLSQEKLRSGEPTSSLIGRISRYRSQTATNLREAILEGAHLHNAYLAGTDLTDADLSDADLTKADLTKANVTEEQLATCASLKGATMPDGTKHE